jgi:hypothetical protein
VYLGFLSDILGYNQLAAGWSGWRLAAGLRPDNRRRLFEGAPLPVSSLDRREQAAVGEFISAAAVDLVGPPLDLAIGPRELPLLSLVLGESRLPADPLARMAQESRGAPRTLELRVAGAEQPLLRHSIQAKW